jgi:hypothetical protein
LKLRPGAVKVRDFWPGAVFVERALVVVVLVVVSAISLAPDRCINMDAAIIKLLLTGVAGLGCLVDRKIVGAPSLACVSQQRRSPRVCHRKFRRRCVRPGKRESGVAGDATQAATV